MIYKVKSFIELFENSGIRYCHWKSTQHLDLTFEGKTDLDVLIDEKDLNKVESILPTIGFKKFEVAKNRRYPFIYDYLSYDKDSDRIIHLHLHTKLNIGPKHHKYILFPFEEKILDSRVKDYDLGNIFRIQLPHELLLLIVRQSVKFRNRDYFLWLLKSFKHHPSFLREFQWLVERVSFAEFKIAVKEVFGDSNFLDMNKIYSFEYFKSPLKILALKTFLYKECLVPLEGRLKSLMKRWYREGCRIWYELYRKLDWPNRNRRKIANGSVIISFVGGDGSGKSSVSEEVYKKLVKQVNTKNIYLGTGDGDNSLVLTLFKPFHKLLHKLKIISVAGKMKTLRKEKSKSKESIIRSILYLPWSLVILYDRYHKLRLLKKYVMKGYLIITDRYPQIDQYDIFDGPKLKGWMAGLEQKIIRQYISLNPYVFRFECSPEITCKRKEEITYEQALFNFETLKEIKLYNNRFSHKVNAEEPFEDVIRNCMSKIFHII